MSSKKSEKQESGFTRLLAWTVVLALVFSAGLITGQRLLRSEAAGPMVSLSSTALAQTRTPDADGEKPSLRTTFSFYEHLTSGKAPTAAQHAKAAVEKPAAKKPAERKEEKPAEKTEAPAQAEKPSEEEAVEKREAEPEAKPAEVAPEKTAQAPPQKVVKAEPAAPAAVDEPAEVLAEIADVLNRDDEPKKQDTAALPARYTLQVSSHPDRESAERELGRLRKMGVEPHAVAVDVPGQGQLWRIRVGKFHNMSEARDFQGSLKSRRGVAGFVTPL